MNETTQGAALDLIDRLIAEKREELERLELGRKVIAGEAAPPPLAGGAAPSPNGRATKAAGCGRADEEDCDGDLHESTCSDCGHIEARCDEHGGRRGAGGSIAAHRRFHCEG